ncbi:MAG: type II toxin-antitoxin system Phd/YefM family antitoxin [Alphaproteobacteria bacterium]
MTKRWTLQDARAHFSQVVEAAQDEPQFVTKWGEEKAVVLSAEEYLRLSGVGEDPKKVLEEMPDVDVDLDWARQWPMRDIDL